jgi:transposase-like protein
VKIESHNKKPSNPNVRGSFVTQGPWGEKFPTVVAAWDRGIPFFAFPPAIRRVIHTTNAIESLNARLRKIIIK